MKLWIFLHFVGTFVVCGGITQEQSAQVLNGYGAIFSGQGVSIDQVFDFHPNCDKKCKDDTPCSKIGGDECIKASQFYDYLTSKPYGFCREGYVCCTPESCQIPIYHSCTQNENLDKDPPCDSLCNVDWRNDSDSYGHLKCQDDCTCDQLPAPQLTLGPAKFICTKDRVFFSGRRHTMYSSGQYFDSNDKAVCPFGFTCRTSGCVNDPEMFEKKKTNTTVEEPDDGPIKLGSGWAYVLNAAVILLFIFSVSKCL